MVIRQNKQIEKVFRSTSTEDTVLHCLPGKNMSSIDEDTKEYKKIVHAFYYFTMSN